MTTPLAPPRTLHLTSVPMNAGHFARVDWTEPGSVHRAVMSLFPEVSTGSAREALGVLYRVEPLQAGGRVIVQSLVPPAIDVGTTKPMPDPALVFPVGTDVRGRVTLNPVKTVNVGPNRRRTRSYVVNPNVLDEDMTERQALTEWAASKLPLADPHFDVAATSLASIARGQKRTPLFTATFDFYGTVQDTAAFAEAVASGVGKARAYGCGLITAIPA